MPHRHGVWHGIMLGGVLIWVMPVNRMRRTSKCKVLGWPSGNMALILNSTLDGCKSHWDDEGCFGGIGGSSESAKLP